MKFVERIKASAYSFCFFYRCQLLFGLDAFLQKKKKNMEV